MHLRYTHRMTLFIQFFRTIAAPDMTIIPLTFSEFAKGLIDGFLLSLGCQFKTSINATYPASLIQRYSQRHYQNDNNAGSVIVVHFRKPQDYAEDLEDVKRVQDLERKKVPCETVKLYSNAVILNQSFSLALSRFLLTITTP